MKSCYYGMKCIKDPSTKYRLTVVGDGVRIGQDHILLFTYGVKIIRQNKRGSLCQNEHPCLLSKESNPPLEFHPRPPFCFWAGSTKGVKPRSKQSYPLETHRQSRGRVLLKDVKSHGYLHWDIFPFPLCIPTISTSHVSI